MEVNIRLHMGHVLQILAPALYLDCLLLTKLRCFLIKLKRECYKARLPFWIQVIMYY
jgi:hypothetical protein